MRRFLRVFSIVGFIILIYSAGSGIKHYWSKAQTYQKNKIFVVCTTSMLADAVQQIGGNCVAVKSLMGPGVDPHLYRARESDVQALAMADIIFYHGLHLEGKMAELLHKMSTRVTTVAVTQALNKEQLIATNFDQIYDPHVWHDVVLWSAVVTYISNKLSERDPDHKEYYQHNANRYIHELSKLDAYIRRKIDRLPTKQRILVTAHDAFAYFGRAYGIEVVGLQGISTDSEISTKDIQDLAALIAEREIKAIFVESSIPVRNVQAVQKAVKSRGWHVKIGNELYSDALGDPHSKAGSYIGMMKHNVDSITKALGIIKYKKAQKNNNATTAKTHET